MSLLSPSIFPVSFLSLSFFFAIISFARGCDPQDRAALLAFSDALDSPLWSATNESTDCCGWVGIRCFDPSSTRNSSRKVDRLVLRNMTLSGPVSSSLGRLSQLRFLDISQNRLSGLIPEELFGMRSLEVLDLSYNSFSGSLSSAVGNLSVTMKRLSGNIPDVFHGLERFEHIQVDFNNFRGPFPVSLSSRPNLQYLNLGNNNLSGQFDSINFTGLPMLEALILRNNRFTGVIPRTILVCKYLKVLDLTNNRLYGQVPWEFRFLSSLSFLFLGDNKLSNVTGALRSLQECRNLTVLDLSWSSTDGEVLGDGILGFPNLKLLRISGYKLHGNFPMWLSRSDELVYLDLSRNYLTGEIPKFLTHLKSLNEYTDQIAGKFAGNFIVYIPIKPTLDLSGNLLVGNSWTLLSNLTHLVHLNLSHNSFTGSIPDSFSKMETLEVLDLSSNQISGTIPTSLKRLTFLAYFCVANNSLHGDVPTGSQFATFSSSCFDGNPDLCYVGKKGCHYPPMSDVQYEEPYKTIDMGIPFAIGISFGYTTTLLFCWVYYKWVRSKQPVLMHRRRR